jgi:hypothetical protein
MAHETGKKPRAIGASLRAKGRRVRGIAEDHAVEFQKSCLEFVELGRRNLAEVPLGQRLRGSTVTRQMKPVHVGGCLMGR